MPPLAPVTIRMWSRNWEGIAFSSPSRTTAVHTAARIPPPLVQTSTTRGLDPSLCASSHRFRSSASGTVPGIRSGAGALPDAWAASSS